jgi:hypothetical protein
VKVSLALALIVSLAGMAAASPASAAYTHVLDEEFSPGCQVHNMAIDYAHEYLYVLCESRVKRFDLEGNEAPFSASEPYLSGNEILYNPAPNARPEFYNFVHMAVDNSDSINSGRLMVPGDTVQLNGGQIVVFEPSGELVAAKTFDSQAPEAIDVDDEGNIYGATFNWQKFDPFFRRTEVIFRPETMERVKVDSNGGAWTQRFSDGLKKFEPEAWSKRTDLYGGNHPPSELEEAGIPIPPPTSPYVPRIFASGDFDVDPTNNDLLVDTNGDIRTFSEGNAAEPAHENAPPFARAEFESHPGNSESIALDDKSNVYVTAEGGNVILKFKRGPQAPDVHTLAVDKEKVGHTDAVVEGVIEPPAGAPVTECEVIYGTSYEAVYGIFGTPETASCTPEPSVGTPFSTTTNVSATLSGLTTGQTYYVRFKAANANGANLGAIREFVPVAVLKLNTLPVDESTVGMDGGTLEGSFDPDGKETKYWFEYGLDTSYGEKTEVRTQNPSSGVVNVSIPIEGLPSGKTLHYRLVAENEEFGTTLGQDQTFRTASPPEISGTRATKITVSSATLNAGIDPVGFDTTYHFEYGPTPDYGQSVPVPDQAIGTNAQPVSQQVGGLEENVTYHFRVVATNKWGTTRSPDATFDFVPPTCPNGHIRQETHAAYLPDCRGYELVSPTNAGSVLLMPTDAVHEIIFKEGRVGKMWPVNTGLATSPPRFAYFGGLGAVNGTEPPNFFFDLYLATRTTTGWATALPGLKGNEGLLVDRARCDDRLDSCIDHNDGEAIFNPIGPVQFAANLFDFNGRRLGTLPSNIDSFPGAEYEEPDVHGDEQLSGDGSHYAFSSLNTAFAPGGITGAPGSAYIDDIATGEVETISYLPGTTNPIPQDGSNPQEYIQLPAISKDGSHVLMSIEGSDGPQHLYLRVGGGDGETYDVSGGHGVTFLGMTGDGTKVDFAATQKLIPADTDEGTDIYQWDENGGSPTLTVLSQGNGNGDSNQCSPVGFGSGCSAVPLTTERGNAYGFLSTPPLDDPIAEGDGDVFFYSPENLDPDRPGIKNQRNLYEFHDGAPRLVTTLQPGTQVSRIQISPDGTHAGLLTAANLTGYDAHGKREMFTYDSETGTVRCASCRPDGLPPISNTTASEGGPFMSNDGRVFFNTKDPLVAQDVDGEITDVYEFVNGRPQLISSGTASRDSTEGSELVNLLDIPRNAKTGLESVSADGNDVFFSTYDTLVPQDKNGNFVKFYDARTNGGFAFEPEFAGCEAADECHNEGTQPPPNPVFGTGAALGNGGNVTHPKHHRKKHRRHKHRRKHHKAKRHARVHRSGAGRRD